MILCLMPGVALQFVDKATPLTLGLKLCHSKVLQLNEIMIAVYFLIAS